MYSPIFTRRWKIQTFLMEFSFKIRITSVTEPCVLIIISDMSARICIYTYTANKCMQQEDARIAFKANLELRTRGQYYLLKCILYVNCIDCSRHSAENTLWWRLANKLSYNCQCYCIITYT